MFQGDKGGEPNITMDGCDTQFANLVERRAVYRMLVESGWIRDGHEEELRESEFTSGLEPETGIWEKVWGDMPDSEQNS